MSEITNILDDVVSELGSSLHGFQDFLTKTDPSSALTQDYKFKLTLNGVAFNSGNDITVSLTANETLASIAAKIQTAINSITASSVTCFVCPETLRIRVKSVSTTQLTSKVALTNGSSASLLTLLGGVGQSITMPQIFNGHKIQNTKTLPMINVCNAIYYPNKPASTNLTAMIKSPQFSIKIIASSEIESKLLQIECERIIHAKNIPGGWWLMISNFEDLGESLGVCNHMLCQQTLWLAHAGLTN